MRDCAYEEQELRRGLSDPVAATAPLDDACRIAV
jgi:hypothetical protein